MVESMVENMKTIIKLNGKKTAKTKKAIVKLTEDSKDIEIFAGL